MAITESNGREQWWVKNLTTKNLVVGDIGRLPTLLPGKVVNLLNFASKEKINASKNLITLGRMGYIQVTKTNEDTQTTYTNATNIKDAIASAEEIDLIEGSITDGRIKVSTNDTTSGFVLTKIVAGANITVMEINDGGNETFEISAAGGSGTVDVANDASTIVSNATRIDFGNGIDVSSGGGGEADVVIVESEIDHDSLANFVVDEHVAHTGVTVTAGDGLSGGGDLSSSFTIDVDINGTTDLAAPAIADELLISDADNANAIRKADLASIVNLADHDALTNFVADEHVAHSGVTITAGDGLSGGGDISATRTIDVDINGTADLVTPAIADELLISDADNANAIRKADLASIVNLADHDALTNFVADEHVDHSGVTITAGDGLSGGGDLTANFTIDVDVASVPAGTVASLDEILIADVDDTDNIKKVTAQSIADLASTGDTLPVADTTSIAEGSADNTKEVRFEVDGNNTGVVGVLATAFTTAKTITFPDATDTLVGKATTDTLTNKTFDANGTGNSLSNVDVADLSVGTDGELITWDASGNPDTVAVGTATHVLTSNGAGAAPTFQAPAAGLPVADTTSIAEGSVDNTKEVRFEVDGNNTGIVGVLATAFTTAKTVTFPDATDTLVGKATTDTLTNKTFDANGTGNSLSNVETADIASGSKSGADVTLVTGTSGTNGNLLEWNGDGDAVDSSLATADVVTGASTDTFTNKTFDANGTGNSLSNVDVADLSVGIDGELITWDVSGNPATVAVGTATHVLTSNGAGAAPTFQAAVTGDTLPVADTTSIAEGSVDNTKEVRFEVDGNNTGVVGVLATAFTTAKTITFPDATDTLVGKATTDTLTNKTFDANGTGNSLSNVETADIASGSKSGADVTLVTGTSGTNGNLLEWNGDGDAVDSSLATADVVTGASTDTFTNKTFDANGTGNSLSNVDVADLAVGTDGELITWDVSGNPATVAVGTATHVLTSNGAGAAPTFQAAVTGDTLPVADTTSIAEGSVDNTKEVRFEVDGNNTGVVGVLATAFTTAKTVTFPDATDTLVGKATTDTLTNKTFDANGTGNSLSNVETADIASGSKSGADVTLVTGTSGTNGNLLEWNVDGDAVDSSLATADVVTGASTDTFTNKTFDANGIGNSLSNVDVADLSVGTDGELITWDATGNPATVAVGTATHVLTSNGAGAAPTFQAAVTGDTLPVADTTSIAEGSADNTKEVRFEVDGNNTGVVGVLATAFTTAKTVTFPDATDTLVGKATTDTLTNKTFDANGTGNSLSNVETADIASGSKSGADVTLVTGTSGTNGNLLEWNVDGDAVDSSLATADVVTGTSTDTFTNKTFDANGTGNSLSNVETADIASGSKSGADVTLVTGTSGTNGNLLEWNGDGDAVDSSLATADVVTGASTDTFTNKTFDANGTGNSLSNVDVADLSVGTDGELITWDVSGNPATVDVGTATHVLTSNGAGAAPTFQAAVTGDTLPVADTTSIAEGSVDNTKEVRFEVDGNNTGIVGVLATAFTTAKTITFPDATDTLVGKATTDTLTNKTFDANGTGNSLSNVETADIASGSKSGADVTLVTGTSGTNGNLLEWNVDGDAVDSSLATADVVTGATTDTFTNKTFDANGTGNSLSNVDVADLAVGTDGELITWDASGNPATVAVGTATHVLTSNGAGAAPTFQAAAGGATVAGNDTEIQFNDGGSALGANSNLTFTTSGTILSIDNLNFDGNTVSASDANGDVILTPDGTGAVIHNFGNISVANDAQGMSFVLREQTTDATQTELFMDGATGTDRMVLPTDSTWAFDIMIVARRTDADGESAGYKFEGIIDNNAGTVALVGNISETILEEDTVAWSVSVNADDINNALRVQVTGEGSKTINWVAYSRIVQVIG